MRIQVRIDGALLTEIPANFGMPCSLKWMCGELKIDFGPRIQGRITRSAVAL